MRISILQLQLCLRLYPYVLLPGLLTPFISQLLICKRPQLLGVAIT